jgi:hypothetical protein
MNASKLKIGDGLLHWSNYAYPFRVCFVAQDAKVVGIIAMGENNIDDMIHIVSFKTINEEYTYITLPIEHKL